MAVASGYLRAALVLGFVAVVQELLSEAAVVAVDTAAAAVVGLTVRVRVASLGGGRL